MKQERRQPLFFLQKKKELLMADFEVKPHRGRAGFGGREHLNLGL